MGQAVWQLQLFCAQRAAQLQLALAAFRADDGCLHNTPHLFQTRTHYITCISMTHLFAAELLLRRLMMCAQTVCFFQSYFQESCRQGLNPAGCCWSINA